MLPSDHENSLKLLDVTVSDPHAIAVDNQDDVFKPCPTPPDVYGALATVDAFALPAIFALNEAHGILVKAGAAIKPPPSDKWYRLIEQLIQREDSADLTQHERRLFVGAAAFLAAEAGDLEDHCAALSDDAAAQNYLSSIADQVRDAVNTLLQHAEHLEKRPIEPSSQPPVSTSQIGATNGKRSAAPWFIAAGLVTLATLYGLVNTFTTPSWPHGLIIAITFVIISLALVLNWYRQARQPHHFTNFPRTPQSTVEWFDEITRQSFVLNAHATALDDLIQRIHLVAGNVAAERQVCESHDLLIAAAKLHSLERLLHDASNSAENLAELVTDSTDEARRFIATCQHDPREACSEYSLLPLILDPERIDATIDNLALVSHLAVEVAVDVPLHIHDKELRISTAPAGQITEGVVSIFQDIEANSRPLKHECRNTLRVFDLLHRMVVTESITTLDFGVASTIAARAAIAASVLTQPRARRPAARTAFVREASASTNRSWIRISKATAAAIKQGQKSLV